ncbi:MAG: T9SS type A sorting domain-containing protein, partial [FCB group bacterium]|nr:T9SS type A sorting domain-containing protein [FCB group bacterium]
MNIQPGSPEIVDYAEFIRRVGGSEELVVIPEHFALHPAYPNPFNPVTTIRCDLPKDSHVTLTVYDIMGRVIEGLIDDYFNAGY